MKDMNKSFIIGLIVAIVLVIFAVQNSEAETISFLVWKAELSLALVLLIAFAVGSIVGYLITFPNIRQKSKELKKRKEEIKNLNVTIQNLRQNQAAGSSEIPKSKKGGSKDEKNNSEG